MRTITLMVTALLIALTTISLDAQQRRRTDEPAPRPQNEPDRRRTSDNDNKSQQNQERRGSDNNHNEGIKKHGDRNDDNVIINTSRERVKYKKSPKVHVVRTLPIITYAAIAIMIITKMKAAIIILIMENIYSLPLR